jgi:hypothetical protein
MLARLCVLFICILFGGEQCAAAEIREVSAKELGSEFEDIEVSAVCQLGRRSLTSSCVSSACWYSTTSR